MTTPENSSSISYLPCVVVINPQVVLTYDISSIIEKVSMIMIPVCLPAVSNHIIGACGRVVDVVSSRAEQPMSQYDNAHDLQLFRSDTRM